MKSARIVCIATACLAVVVSLLSSGVATGEDKEKDQKKSEPQIVKKILKVEYVEEEKNPPNTTALSLLEWPGKQGIAPGCHFDSPL